LGRGVLLSFADDRCQDLCTLLAEDVATADRDLGPLAKSVAFTSIDANQYGRSVSVVEASTDNYGLASAKTCYFGSGSAKTLAALV
jgi:hypothetical protein